MTPLDGVEGAPPRPFFARRGVQLALLTVLTVVVLAAVWITIDVLRVRSAVSDARQQVDDLTAQLKVYGPGGEDAIARQLAQDVEKAHDITHGPAWGLGKRLPFVGGDFQVVAEATASLTDIADQGIEALTDLSDERDQGTLGLTKGRVDIAVLQSLAPRIDEAAGIFDRGGEKFDRIDLDRAHDRVREPLEDVRRKLKQAQSLLHTASTALDLAPAMLGQEKPRTYLLVIQNNAELRATGGIPGAFAELRVADGRLTIERQGSGAQTGYFDPPAVRSTPDEKRLYSTLMANFWNDANFTPDFPRTAEILRAMYKIRFGTKLDGVVSVDPVALAHLLHATGPVRVNKDVVLDQGSVVPILLHAVYNRYPDDDVAQNAFFALAARKVFEKFISGSSDAAGLIRALNAASEENRILLNATNALEQDLIAGTRLAGELRNEPTRTPHIGLYVNDSTAAKLEYFLRRKSVVSGIDCTAAGTQTFLVNTVLESLAPEDVVDLGHGVTGFARGAKTGEMSMVLSYYAPYGGKVTKLSVDGEEQSVNRNQHNGLFVATVPVTLLPGETHTVTVTMESGPGQTKDAVFRTTPGVEPAKNNLKVPSTCR